MPQFAFNANEAIKAIEAIEAIKAIERLKALRRSIAFYYSSTTALLQAAGAAAYAAADAAATRGWWGRGDGGDGGDRGAPADACPLPFAFLPPAFSHFFLFSFLFFVYLMLFRLTHLLCSIGQRLLTLET